MKRIMIIILLIFMPLIQGCSTKRYPIQILYNEDFTKYIKDGEVQGIKTKYLTIWENILNEKYVLMPVKDGIIKVLFEDEFPPRVHFIRGFNLIGE